MPPTRLHLLALLSILPSTIYAQTLLPTVPTAQFPACALSCPLLIQAQASCVPPAAPATSQSTYVSCFCQFSLLAPLYSSPHGVCDVTCTAESDLDTLQGWYKGFCASGGGLQSTSASSATTLQTSASTVIVVPSSAASTSGSSSGSGVGANASDQKQQGWFATHWRWVVMLIALLIGLLLLALLARFLKKRHRRKLEAERARLSGFPNGNSVSELGDGGRDMWGPHQHMAHTRGWEYNNGRDAVVASGGLAAERSSSRRDPEKKGKGRVGAKEREVDHSVSGRRGSGRGSRKKRHREREREQESEKEAERGWWRSKI